MSGLQSLLRRKKTEQELDEELSVFLDMAVEEKMKCGMSREDALRAVRVERGSRELSKEVVHTAGWEFVVETLWQDLRFGVRMLRKSPAFAAVAILTLALGIGASTIIFSVIDAVLLRSLPYRDPSRLVVIYDHEAKATGLSKLLDLHQDFEAYRDHSQSFDQLAGMTWITGNPTLTGFGPSKEIHQVQVTLNFFSLLGISPTVGRTFATEDLTRGCSVVLAHQFWKEVLGAQDTLIGNTIQLDDQACDVVGVMPSTFAFFPADTDIWTLIGPNNKLERDSRHSGVAIYGHLKPGVSVSAATEELVALHGVANEYNQHAEQTLPLVLPLQEELTWITGPNLRLSLIVLFVAVSALLLIACGNVANLLLTRSLSRQRELAIRSALGSGTVRLLRQLFTESVLLSVSSAAIGACLAVAAIHLFNITKPVDLPSTALVRVNAQVLLFTVGLSALTTIVFGLLPAWRGSKTDLAEVLKGSGHATQSVQKRHTAKILIVAEVMLSLVLLAGAGLLMGSAARFASIPLGFIPNRVMTMAISLPPKTYGTDGDRARMYDRILESLAAIPGLQSTAASSMLPFRPIQGFDALEIEGQPPSTAETAHHDAGTISISPRYFSSLGIPLLKGRSFSADDQSQTEAVAIVNEALVKKYFGNDDDPVGRHVRSLGAPTERNPWRRIIGVVADEKRGNPFQEMSWLDTPVMFLPIAQVPPSRVTLLLRSDIDPTGLTRTVQRQVSMLDPNIPTSNVQTVEHLLMKEHLSFPRFRALVVGSFAGFALLLAAIGLYGVLSQLVTQRTNEIGLRMALGADAGNILKMITKEGMLLVGLGMVLGIVSVFILGRFLARLLYGVKSSDPATLAVASILLLAGALAATLLPARRAMRLDPMVAIRHE